MPALILAVAPHCLVAEHLLLAREFGVPRHIAVALRSGALLEPDAARAIPLLREAVELLRDGPARLERARAMEQLGVLLGASTYKSPTKPVTQTISFPTSFGADSPCDGSLVATAGHGSATTITSGPRTTVVISDSNRVTVTSSSRSAREPSVPCHPRTPSRARSPGST